MKAVMSISLPGCIAVLLVLALSACAGHSPADASAAEAESPYRIELPGLSEAERAAIDEGDKARGEPLQTGLGRDLEDGQARIPLASLDWQATGDRRQARFVVQSTGANGLRLGMALSAAGDCPLTFRFAGPDGSPGESVPAARLEGSDGLWWSPIVPGDTVVVHLAVPRDARVSACDLRVPTLSHLY